MVLIIITIAIIIYSLCQNKQISGFNQIGSPSSNSFKLNGTTNNIDYTNVVAGYANNNDPFRKPFILNNFITPQKCKQIINYANDKLFDSEVIGGKHKEIRNSQQCWIPKNNSIVIPMFQKVSQMFNIPVENAEDLQVVRYRPNQYYNEHHDACCDDDDNCKRFISRGGQRKLTVLVYLNNDFGEGHTNFPNLNIKVKPKVGDAVVFFPLADGTSKCHPLSLHAGMPVTSGEKWVANLWFREGNFDKPN